MSRKLFLASLASFLLVLFSVFLSAHSTVRMTSKIGPTTATSLVSISISSAPDSNCITDVDVVSTADYTFRILNGGTTGYAIALSSGQGVVWSWDEATAICGSSNTTTYLSISAGAYNINYRGFTQ